MEKTGRNQVKSEFQQTMRLGLGGILTPAVKTLLWLNGFTFVFIVIAKNRIFIPTGQTYAQTIISLLGLFPSAVIQDLAIWQPITYLFVHQQFFHFLFNMLGLWWFGADLEAKWGTKRFIRYYLFTGIGAGITSMIFNVPTIGASGAIYGLLLAYGLSFPDRIFYLYFLIPIKAKYCTVIFALIELFSLMVWGSNGVNHFAHLGGIVFGLSWFWGTHKRIDAWSFWKSLKKKRMRRKLRLISPKSPKSEDGEDNDPFGSYSNRTIH